MLDYPVPFWLVGPLAVFLISALKGAFGGGFALLGIHLLALAISPLDAAALLAPLFCLADLVALRYWRPGTWSRPDLAALLPGLVAGIGIGAAAFALVDPRLVTVGIAIVTLGFAGRWFSSGGRIQSRPRSTARAALFGTASGFTTFVAHSGGPPLAMYLLPLGLPKAVYAGTTSLFFTVGNAIKVVPYLFLGALEPVNLVRMAEVSPFVPLGVWIGWRMHGRLPQHRLYQACYALLVPTGLMLLYEGLEGFR
jgi:uncharacterized membrane protein YfcA